MYVEGGLVHLVVLEPLIVGRIVDAFNVGLALRREETVREDEVNPPKEGLRPLTYLCLEDLSAGPEPVQAEEPGLPRVDNDVFLSTDMLMSHLALFFR